MDDNLENNELKEWLKQFIIKFRKKKDEQPVEVQQMVAHNRFLQIPCQVDVVWLQNKKYNLNFQIFIITNWFDYNDLEITVHGPIDRKESIKFLEKLVENKKWRKPLPDTKQSQRNFSDRLKTLISDAIIFFK